MNDNIINEILSDIDKSINTSIKMRETWKNEFLWCENHPTSNKHDLIQSTKMYEWHDNRISTLREVKTLILSKF